MILLPRSSYILQNDHSMITYKPNFFNALESEEFFEFFLEKMPWVHDEAVIYGKHIVTKRKIAWYGDSGFDYNYSGKTRIAHIWTPELVALKRKLENHCGEIFNSCLLNLYHDGSEGMAFHSDDQNHLKPNSSVAIISLGAERYFKIRETKTRFLQSKTLLSSGSLLVMSGECQKHYQHEIPKMAAIKTPRISLTWRSMK
jgi:alkylated DNA repair dioxygenase AlkB